MALFIYPSQQIDTTGLATEAKQDDLIATQDLTVVDFMDTPLLEAASTNIPGAVSAPLSVVTSLAQEVRAIHFQDTTGEYIGIYRDPAGAAELIAIINPGSDSIVRIKIAASDSIGLRNMKNSPISVGDLVLQFLG